MEARVDVLEEIASATKGALKDMRDDFRIWRDDVNRELHALRDDIRSARTKQESDFRLMFGVLIATALGMASLMAKGFHWL